VRRTRRCSRPRRLLTPERQTVLDIGCVTRFVEALGTAPTRAEVPPQIPLNELTIRMDSSLY
jgi:hypothetical protein